MRMGFFHVFNVTMQWSGDGSCYQSDARVSLSDHLVTAARWVPAQTIARAIELAIRECTEQMEHGPPPSFIEITDHMK